MYKHFEICDGINCVHCNECSNRYEILEDIWLDNNICLRKGKFIHGHVSPMWIETNLIKRVFTPNVSQSVKEIASTSESSSITETTTETENASNGLDCVLGIIDSLNTVESSIKVKPLQTDIKTEIKSNADTKTEKVVKALKEIKTPRRTKTTKSSTKTRRTKTSKI